MEEAPPPDMKCTSSWAAYKVEGEIKSHQKSEFLNWPSGSPFLASM